MELARSDNRSDGLNTRERILNSAVTLIAEGGVSAATQRKVAAHAGVSLSSVVYYFQTATELIDAAYDCAVERYCERMNYQRDQTLVGNITLIEACLRSVREPDGAIVESATVVYDMLVDAIRRPEHRERAIALVNTIQDFFAPWTAHREYSLGATATFLSLSLIGMLMDSRNEVTEQMEFMFDLFGISEILELRRHQRESPETDDSSNL